MKMVCSISPTTIIADELKHVTILRIRLKAMFGNDFVSFASFNVCNDILIYRARAFSSSVSKDSGHNDMMVKQLL